MADENLEEAIREAYASAPSDEVILETAELRHSQFTSPIRVVKNYADTETWRDLGGADVQAVLDGLDQETRDQVGLVARLEADAPEDAGEYVAFIAMAFEIILPKVDTGATPELTVTMDNVGQEISDQLDLAAVSREKIEVIYRPYLSTDISKPQVRAPLTLEMTNVKVGVYKVIGRARMFAIGASRFPSKRYTATRFPGLIR